MTARPRLGAHVQPRRHVVGGVACVILHDGERALQLGEREWTVLRQADGTRDLEGIRVAAARAGAAVRAEHARAFFAELGALGLLDEHEEARSEPSFAPDRPIVPLPGYHFRCSGAGHCCRQFDTVLFSPVEVARARAALPELGEAGLEPERVFLPQYGASSFLSAVTRSDGACLYFDAGSGCRIHDVKPVGCRTFPERYVDAGDVIRATVHTECACVFARPPASDAERQGRPARGSELPREVYVPAVPQETPMGPDVVGRAALLAFFDAARERVEAGDDDLAALCWSLADRVEREGARARIEPSAPEGVEAHLASAKASADRLARTHVGWRGEDDFVRVAIGAACGALSRLGSGVPARARAPEDEVLYLRAAFFATLGAERGVTAELRERAVAIWIARAWPDETAHPLAIVEALARGHGLSLGAGNREPLRTMKGP